MEKLLKHITDYLEYINESEPYSVTVHFSNSYLKRLPRSVLDAFSPFNTHEHPYCIAVKARGGQAKCVSSQRAILADTQKTDGFIRICHAGVWEYIMPVREQSERIAYVSVTGYREKEKSEGVIDIPLWESTLLSEKISVEEIETRIAPLCLMLKVFLPSCQAQEESEYALILQFLNEYHTDTDLKAVCEHFSRSPSYVSHTFKKKSGMTVRAYCNNLKLEDAKRLLRSTDRSVTDIAFDVGFHDVSYFIRLFRENEGVSPLRYRKQGEK